MTESLLNFTNRVYSVHSSEFSEYVNSMSAVTSNIGFMNKDEFEDFFFGYMNHDGSHNIRTRKKRDDLGAEFVCKINSEIDSMVPKRVSRLRFRNPCPFAKTADFWAAICGAHVLQPGPAIHDSLTVDFATSNLKMYYRVKDLKFVPAWRREAWVKRSMSRPNNRNEIFQIAAENMALEHGCGFTGIELFETTIEEMTFSATGGVVSKKMSDSMMRAMKETGKPMYRALMSSLASHYSDDGERLIVYPTR